MSWLGGADTGATAFDRVLGLRPELLDAYRSFLALFWTRRPVDPVILELCRLRVAQLLGCAAELAIRYRPARVAGLDEARVAALAAWPASPAFSDAERACLAYAEQFVMDPHGIGDADAAAVGAHLGAAGLVALTEALALFEGFARVRAILGIAPETLELDAGGHPVEAP